MFENTPFEAIAKTMQDNAGKFNPAAAQEALKPVMDNLKAWGEMAQSQAKATQAAMTESVETLKGIKAPQDAFEAMQASAGTGMALATKHLKEATALGVAQFQASIEALEKTHTVPESLASVTQTLKAAAAAMETALDTALKNGEAAVAAVKKPR
ncbi:MAG: hypothetical protein JZU60_01850 [Ilumatobacteraceae bacterium]|jgi:hypothetical protein|nr:hypothetical protein [Ilumatobacteraceae bacterium]